MPGNAPDGYGDYVIVHLINSFSSSTLSVKNAYLKHGKFHQNGNKDNEIAISVINQITLPANSASDICSCGRSSALYGTEGSFELYDGNTKICKIYWSDPYSGNNDFQVQDYKIGGTYMVAVGDWNRSGGSLGELMLKLPRRAKS